jgi:hypothetical protein
MLCITFYSPCEVKFIIILEIQTAMALVVHNSQGGSVQACKEAMQFRSNRRHGMVKWYGVVLNVVPEAVAEELSKEASLLRRAWDITYDPFDDEHTA